MNYTIDITSEMECQMLLALRYAELKGVHKPKGLVTEHYDDDYSDVTYELQEGDPIPQGLSVGNFLMGTLRPIGSGREDEHGFEIMSDELVPVFHSSGD